LDRQDYLRLHHHTWFVKYNEGGRYKYVRRKEQVNGVQKTIPMHREILNAKPGKVVDHVNGNGLDNRRKNIRECTVSHNAMNKVGRTSGSSKYKGVAKVVFDSWIARIVKNYRIKNIGTFRSERDAALAYDLFALRLFKDFSRLNFPRATECARKKAFKRRVRNRLD